MAIPHDISTPQDAASTLGRARRYQPDADHSAEVAALATARIAHKAQTIMEQYGLAALPTENVTALAALLDGSAE